MQQIRKVWRPLAGALTAVLAVLLVCSIYSLAVKAVTGEKQPDILGWSVSVVITGSMSPAIEPGDMIIIREGEEYGKGDIILYESGESLVTHRIVGEREEGFVTKGDANNAEDGEAVKEEDIKGRVRLVIPKAGFVTEYLRTPLGMTCLAAAGFLLIEIPVLMERHREKKRRTGGKDRWRKKE